MTDTVLQFMQQVGKPVPPGNIAKELGVESKDVPKPSSLSGKEARSYPPSVVTLSG